MATVILVSSGGQIVLPAAMRRRLGLGAGAQVEVIEEADGVKLRVVRQGVARESSGMAGLVKAPVRGVPRSLENFDPVSTLRRSESGKR